MPIDGFVEYKRREYCNDVGCPIQMMMNAREGTDDYEALRAVCKNNCVHTTYEFHHWLMERGYAIVRPKN